MSKQTMSQKMFLKTLGLAMCFALGAQDAAAANAGSFYIGADVGSTQVTGDTSTGKDSVFVAGQKFKDSDTSYGLHAGFQFTDWFAAELGYTDFGSTSKRFKIRPDIMFIVAPNDTQVLDAKGVSLSGVFSYSLSQSFSVLGVVGVTSINYDSTWKGGFSPMTGSLRENHSSTEQGILLGVGGRYALTDSVALRVDLRRNDVGDFALDTASVGLEYNF